MVEVMDGWLEMRGGWQEGESLEFLRLGLTMLEIVDLIQLDLQRKSRPR